jgi:hypothetical protein
LEEYERVQAAYEFPSETLWSVYISEADKYDTMLAEGWKDDMDSTLIFVSGSIFDVSSAT